MHLHDTLCKRSFKSTDKLDAVFDALSSNKKEKCDMEVMPVQKVISNCDVDGMVKAKTTQRVFTWQKKQTNVQLSKRYLNDSYVTKLVGCTVVKEYDNGRKPIAQV